MSVRSEPEFDFDRTIQAWLEPGPTELSGTVVDRARAEVHRTRQRGNEGTPLRLPLGRPRQAAATFLLAAVVVALVGIGVRIVSTPVVGTKPTSSPVPTLRAAPGSTAPSFLPTGSMAVGRVGHTATLLQDGRVLIAGGSEYMGDGRLGPQRSVLLASAELYDPASGTFSPTGSMATARAHHTATLLASGRVLIAGGGNSGAEGGGFALASAELYDPATGRFSPAGSMDTARLGATATHIGGGLVLIAGGGSAFHDNVSDALASAELYDEATNAFAPTGFMSVPRAGPIAALLADGRVLLAGGSAEQSAEIYDPATHRFGRVANITAPDGSAVDDPASAIALHDGRVLIVGGFGGPHKFHSAHPTAFAWLFDPEYAAFTPTGQPTVGGWDASATLLADGRVMLVGGIVYSSLSEIADAEIYDPTTGTFTSTAFPRYSLSCASTGCGSLNRARTGHTATLLLDGRVLIAGGGNATNRELATTSAEIFQ